MTSSTTSYQYQKDIYKSLTQYLSQYLINTLTEFSDLIFKKLSSYQIRIKNYEQSCKQLLQKISYKTSIMSSASLNSIQQNCNGNIQQNKASLQQQSKKVQQMRKALQKMETGIFSLQKLLKQSKYKNHLQDPKYRSQIQDPQNLIQNRSNQNQKQAPQTQIEENQTTITKIKQLNRKINKLAKQNNILKPHQADHYTSKNHIKFQKSNSFISLSNRKFYPLSCPKKYNYGSLIQKYNHSSDLSQNSAWNMYIENGGISASQINSNSEIKVDKNKMPLINKSKNLINQLKENVKDSHDADLVKFYLKKTFFQLQKTYSAKSKIQKSQYTVQNQKTNYTSQTQKIISQKHKLECRKKKEMVPEYFANRKNIMYNISNNKGHINQEKHQNSFLYNADDYHNIQNHKSSCSIQNYDNYQQEKQNSKKFQLANECQPSNLELLRVESRKSSIKQNIISQIDGLVQKKKYFQRTNSEHKLFMLNKKLKSQMIKL